MQLLYKPTQLTVRKGCFVFLSTWFSVLVWATSSFWMMRFFLRIFMAYSFPVPFSRDSTTLPNVPFPNTFTNSNFSKVCKLHTRHS